jgi:hypothetical protein
VVKELTVGTGCVTGAAPGGGVDVDGVALAGIAGDEPPGHSSLGGGVKGGGSSSPADESQTLYNDIELKDIHIPVCRALRLYGPRFTPFFLSFRWPSSHVSLRPYF